MLYSQPLATRFGTDLTAHLSSGIWKTLDIAVAWVRASGIDHLTPALIPYLKSGNKLSMVVGIDLDNTTKEGLEALLNLQSHGAVSIVVHHNESGTIFHPKVYLFRNATKAKLIVGSNNITEAGLFRNTELGLELNVGVTDPTAVSALNAIDSWRDTSHGLARLLDSSFLADLVSNGYVKDEATVRAEFASRKASALPKNVKQKNCLALFQLPPPRNQQ